VAEHPPNLEMTMSEEVRDGKKLTYLVNGEKQVTSQHKLMVRVILADAGFDPVEQYKLERDEGHHVYANYDEEVPLHEGERFTATYLGPTPTS
jgi:hypothetical protein